LQKKWGYSSFRPLQEEIISSVLAKQNTIVLLPTGGGKSICYQLPTLLQEGVCLVISPLLALMQDQIDSLHRKNIKAVALNTALSQDEMVILFDNIQYNNIKFLYLSPEKLQSNFIQDKIKQLNISLVAIDEAHCISEWGHDFRPAYLQLNILKEICPSANTIALTASATKEVLEDLSLQLQLDKPVLYKNSFKRENLAYQIFEVEDKFFKIKQILTKIKAPSIIYTNTRNETKKISDFLNREGFGSTFYHGGLSAAEKKTAYDKWYSEETYTIVATNAFGMGIDKPNIRVVIHVKLPNSIENYMQEAGRGGRDGKKAFSVTLKNRNDLLVFKNTMEQQQLTIEFVKKVYFQLNQYYKISKGEFQEKLFSFNLNDFCNNYKLPFSQTYSTLKTLDIQGILQFTEGYQKRTYLKFITSSENVLDYGFKYPSINNFIKTILRSYGGLFENFVPINEYSLSKQSNLTKKQLTAIFEKLKKDGIVKYIPATNNASINFLVPREDDRTINSISKRISYHQKNKSVKANKLLDFIENNSVCRSKQLLTYFNEKHLTDCGICDVCIQYKMKTKTLSLTKSLLSLLTKQQELTSREICELLNQNEKEILATLKQLLEENKIRILKGNKFKINI